MTTDDGYAAWLRANPAPDLQELVSKHGGYDKITPEAWAEYDRALAEWRERRQARAEDGPSAEIPHSDYSAAVDPEALCICGLAGAYMRPRKRGRKGGPIWRCEEHKDKWPDYADAPDEVVAQAASDDKDADRINRYVERPQYDEPYDAASDFENRINECYREVRARVAAGGKGWNPP